MAPRYKWQPLRRAVPQPPSEVLIEDYLRLQPGWTREKVLAHLDREERTTTTWRNDLYQVMRREIEPGIIHLNIRRVDGNAIVRDWRHFQQIKNELIGEECEAVELYPAESRKVDTSNKYHLIGVLDPTYRFPFGDIFGNKRDVDYTDGRAPGTRQRPE